MKEKFWRIKKDAEIPFHNNVDYCIGTGRMGLALQKEYQDQLELVQKKAVFPISGAMDCFQTIWPFTRNTPIQRERLMQSTISPIWTG